MKEVRLKMKKGTFFPITNTSICTMLSLISCVSMFIIMIEKHVVFIDDSAPIYHHLLDKIKKIVEDIFSKDIICGLHFKEIRNVWEMFYM